MAEIMHNGTETSTADLVRGIIKDAEELLAAQLALVRTEMKAEVSKARDAVMALVTGSILSLTGLIILAMAVGYLLPWIWPEFPQWASFGAVAIVILVIAGCLMLVTRQRLSALKPEKTLESIEENVRWMTKK